jgi:hypothetical protein
MLSKGDLALSGLHIGALPCRGTSSHTELSDLFKVVTSSGKRNPEVLKAASL